MAQYNEQAALEQTLTEGLAQLPVPIRIVHRSAWYQWSTPPAGDGDVRTFEDAVIGAIAYQQQEYERTQRLSGQPRQYTSASLSTLGECLENVRKVRPTAILFLYLGNRGWLESSQARELVIKSRDIDLYWDAYLTNEGGQEGIYLFGTDRKAYRAFDVEDVHVSKNNSL